MSILETRSWTTLSPNSGGPTSYGAPPIPLAPGAARREHHRDLVHELQKIDGLRVIIVAAGGERLLAIARHRVSGERDDRYRLRRSIAFERLRHRPAVHHREVHVEQDEIGLVGAHLVEPFLTVLRHDHLITA